MIKNLKCYFGVLLLLLAVSLIGLSVNANQLFSKPKGRSIIKLDPEMTGIEYARMLDRQNQEARIQTQGKNRIDMKISGGGKPEDSEEDKVLAVFLEYGKRTLQWVEVINRSRPEGQKISFSSEATQSGNTIVDSRVYNFKIISEKWEVLKTLLPNSLKAVIFENSPLTEVLPVSEREFIEWLFQVDRTYQLSARYTMLRPYKNDYIGYQSRDVRGYLALKDEFLVPTDLANWEQLSISKKEKYRKALIYLCQNSDLDREECGLELQRAEKEAKLVEMRDLHFAVAKENYDRFFAIEPIRNDITWNSRNSLLFTVPFRDPKNERVSELLKKNVEDEFRWNGWKLFLNFVESDSEDITHIVFEEGVTPHVDGTGNVITMDANVPFSEYDIQWTVRHEYGHTLGFPDCYHEFYDEELEAFVSYQLDITNLMCSRRGHFKQIHFDELKRVYYKESK